MPRLFHLPCSVRGEQQNETHPVRINQFISISGCMAWQELFYPSAHSHRLKSLWSAWASPGLCILSKTFPQASCAAPMGGGFLPASFTAQKVISVPTLSFPFSLCGFSWDRSFLFCRCHFFFSPRTDCCAQELFTPRTLWHGSSQAALRRSGISWLGNSAEQGLIS